MICWHGLQRRIGKPTRSTNGGATRLHTLTPHYTTSSVNAITVIAAVHISIDQCSLANALAFCKGVDRTTIGGGSGGLSGGGGGWVGQ
jgi:hypothetical protein